jgi:hypothetical protein
MLLIRQPVEAEKYHESYPQQPPRRIFHVST